MKRILPTLIIFVALLQGLLHIFLLPPWQHYDEPTHFEYAWLIANRGELPQLGDRDHLMQRQVATSMREHNFYWNLVPPNLLSDENEISLGFTELAHPPAYYLLVSLPLRVLRHLDMTRQLYVARSISLLLFLFIIGVTIGLTRDLMPPEHLLRWTIPLTVALLPPFASHMTAVNNDVGAVAMLSLFMWGSIRLIRYGISLPRLLWVISSAFLAVLSKNTGSLALPMLPLAITVALWIQLKWRWRWFFLAGFGIVALTLMTMVDIGDAAYWYRDEFHAHQTFPTRITAAAEPAEPLGSNTYAITLEVTNRDVNRRILNPLLPQDVEKIRGSVVTIGGWLWADKEAQVLSPGFLRSDKRSVDFIANREAIHVTTEPTFFTHSYSIPEETAVLYYAFWAKPLEPIDQPLQLYLNSAFLIQGEWPNDLPYPNSPSSLPKVVQEHNLVRNPSAEQSWLRLRPWVHQTLERYSRRSPTYVFSAMQDLAKNGPFLLGVIAPWLLYDFFSAFAWGHVRLSGALWLQLPRVLFIIALLGSIKYFITSRSNQNRWQWPALFFLALVAFIVSLNAILWPLPFQWGKIQFPSSRYLYVAIIPLSLFLAGGWWLIWPRRYRRQAAFLWIGLLLLLNILSIVTIYSFYQSLPIS